jgi:hypothetical protein
MAIVMLLSKIAESFGFLFTPDKLFCMAVQLVVLFVGLPVFAEKTAHGKC